MVKCESRWDITAELAGWVEEGGCVLEANHMDIHQIKGRDRCREHVKVVSSIGSTRKMQCVLPDGHTKPHLLSRADEHA